MEQAIGFATTALESRPRVLEIGYGQRLADRLASLGFSVTAGSYASLEDLPREAFDAIVITQSLHVDDSLTTTLAQLEGLLRPGGRLIVDEIDVAAANETTLRWYFDMLDRFAPSEPMPSEDAVTRWQREHANVVHTGEHIRLAISARFAIRHDARVEHLYQRIASRMRADDPETKPMIARIREKERELISQGVLRAVGLQLVADRLHDATKCDARIATDVVCERERGHGGLHLHRSRDGRAFEWG